MLADGDKPIARSWIRSNDVDLCASSKFSGSDASFEPSLSVWNFSFDVGNNRPVAKLRLFLNES